MVATLDCGTRRARKSYRCGLCSTAIKPGDLHAFQVNIYDGRIYTWRDCIWCERAGVMTYVHDWVGGWNDGGVGYESAYEWAMDAVTWPRTWLRPGWRITADERIAARDWLARASAAMEVRL